MLLIIVGRQISGIVLPKILQQFIQFPSSFSNTFFLRLHDGATSTHRICGLTFSLPLGPKESGSDEWQGQVFWERWSFRPGGVHERHKAPLSAPSVSDTRLRWHAFQRGIYTSMLAVPLLKRRQDRAPRQSRRWQKIFTTSSYLDWAFSWSSSTAPASPSHDHYGRRFVLPSINYTPPEIFIALLKYLTCYRSYLNQQMLVPGNYRCPFFGWESVAAISYVHGICRELYFNFYRRRIIRRGITTVPLQIVRD